MLLNLCWYLDSARCIVVASHNLECQFAFGIQKLEITSHLKEIFPFCRKASHSDDFVAQLKVRLDRRTVLPQFVDKDIFANGSASNP